MKKCIFLLFIVFCAGCGTIQPTPQENLFLGVMRECFAGPDDILLKQHKALLFLRGKTDYAESFLLYHNLSDVVDAEAGTVHNMDTIAVRIRRVRVLDKILVNAGTDRPFISGSISDCEWVRENYINIKNIRVK